MSEAKSEPLQQLASVTARPRFLLSLRSLADVVELARVLYAGGIQPEGVSRAESLVPILLTGMDHGLTPMQSVRWIMKNPNGGGCSVWGDGGLAIVMTSGQLVDRSIEYTGTPGQDDRTCTVRLSRSTDTKSFGREYSYSMAIAKKLRSYKINNGPWATDPDNMLYWRALWRAMRREFADVLLGITGVEEDEDFLTVDVVTPAPQLGPAGEVIEMIDEDQLEEIVRLRGLAEDAISDGDRLLQVWAAHLKPFEVASARDLTRADATKLIAELTEQYDPFTAPPQSTA
jgi:hypothetical protein